MRLTLERDRERLQRFAHLRPASLGRRRCGEVCPGSNHRCTREGEHRGLHASHGSLGRLSAVWDGRAEPSPGARETAVTTRRDRSEVRRANRRDAGERDGDAMELGALAAVWARLRRLLQSPEELALVILFLGLVAWAASVAWQIVSRW